MKEARAFLLRRVLFLSDFSTGPLPSSLTLIGVTPPKTSSYSTITSLLCSSLLITVNDFYATKVALIDIDAYEC